MSKYFICISLALIAQVTGFSAVRAQTATQSSGAQQCSALRSADFSRIPDALTEIMDAKWAEPDGQTAGYCQVSGYVAPSIGFLLRLPAENWNGKFIELGCGGTCGTTEHISGCRNPLRRGYACIVSDGGNSSSGKDMKWAYNNPQAVVDYVVRASHVTAIAGKEIAEQYYERAPRTSYFVGCSAGGLQALSLAQRFPWDFDGIIAGDPSMSVSEDWMNWLWAYRTLVNEHGERILSQQDLESLHRAVVNRCDLNDGIKDGVIGDPRICSFDPKELSCSKHAAEGCLSASQVDAVRKMYAGPSTSQGAPIGAPFAFKGSELNWIEPDSTEPNAYLAEWFRYYLFQPNPGPSWVLNNFDFDRDYKRFGVAELTEPLNPDLRRFRASGGKLLLYSGWNDTAASVGRTVDYYENAEKLMGGRSATQNFFRLFVVPGMNHCSGGDGAYHIDYLAALETWVEQGQAPEKLIGIHPKENVNPSSLEFPLDPEKAEFSRPIYPYPLKTKYPGKGDPKDAESFGPVR